MPAHDVSLPDQVGCAQMPSVPRNPKLPTLYLDWSHVSDAASSTWQANTFEWAPLAALVASGRTNVCLSIVHLLELRAWPDITRAASFARWADGLNLVWMEGSPRIEIGEAKNALLRALDVEPAKYEPFVGGFVQLLATDQPVETVAEMQAQPTLSTFLGDTNPSSLDPLRAHSLRFAQDLARDGGAYCDVFTCDAQTATHLHELRVSRGMQPPLATKHVGGPAGFINAIEAQLQVATHGGICAIEPC